MPKGRKINQITTEMIHLEAFCFLLIRCWLKMKRFWIQSLALLHFIKNLWNTISETSAYPAVILIWAVERRWANIPDDGPLGNFQKLHTTILLFFLLPVIFSRVHMAPGLLADFSIVLLVRGQDTYLNPELFIYYDNNNYSKFPPYVFLDRVNHKRHSYIDLGFGSKK